eukprot:m.121791 g.121791  ORF g.121791 m.121791 type:complete len:192 (+) comp52104_c0_seq8:1194-1769(+)
MTTSIASCSSLKVTCVFLIACSAWRVSLYRRPSSVFKSGWGYLVASTILARPYPFPVDRLDFIDKRLNSARFPGSTRFIVVVCRDSVRRQHRSRCQPGNTLSLKNEMVLKANPTYAEQVVMLRAKIEVLQAKEKMLLKQLQQLGQVDEHGSLLRTQAEVRASKKAKAAACPVHRDPPPREQTEEGGQDWLP